MSFHSVLIVQLGDHDEIRLCHLPIFQLRQRAIRDDLRRFAFKLLPVVSMVNALRDEGSFKVWWRQTGTMVGAKLRIR